MRLADFITTNSDAILAEWVTFAATCGPAGKAMELPALRDHALEMLKNIATDLRTPQTDAQQVAKSKRNAAPAADSTRSRRVPCSRLRVNGSNCQRAGFTVCYERRTIADLDGDTEIGTPHVAEALGYRPRAVETSGGELRSGECYRGVRPVHSTGGRGLSA